MRLNTLSPAPGSKKTRKRVGRGIASGLGKTAGRGHKGQTARAGGIIKIGFEGGQMPLQRRLPKRGFASRTSRYVGEVRLYQLQAMKAEVIDLDSLKAEGVIGHVIRKVKVVNTGKLERAVTLRGLNATKGARAAIESAGGKVE